jgi:hypothetical protein
MTPTPHTLCIQVCVCVCVYDSVCLFVCVCVGVLCQISSVVSRHYCVAQPADSEMRLQCEHSHAPAHAADSQSFT